jgi:hypothetical protein
MAGLAGAFDPATRRASMDRQLVPGCVIYLDIAFPQITKPKYCVCVGSDGDELVLIVNSDVSKFVQARPSLLRCQVEIDARSHPFLRHDSHVACHEVHRLARSDILDSLTHDPPRMKGPISDDVRDQIKAAVKAAVTLDVRLQTIIINALA